MKNIPSLTDRLQAFVKLGDFIRDALDSGLPSSLLHEAQLANPWFVEPEIKRALQGLSVWLNKDTLEAWVAHYAIPDEQPIPCTVAVVMAGNIPVVNFHDVLSVLVSGHKLLGKLSHQDPDLLPWLMDALLRIEPRMAKFVQLTRQPISDFQAVIATGSGNSGRYFSHYFKKYPHIIRGHRNAVGVLTGEETDAQIEAFGPDVFAYFGMGCRNISSFLLPESFPPERLAAAWHNFQDRIHHGKYLNNYEYRKAIYLVNGTPHLDNGFLLIVPSLSLSAPIATLHYQTYRDAPHLQEILRASSSKLQVVVGVDSFQDGCVSPGFAQQPTLMDYPDHVDVMEFLQSLRPKFN